MFCTASHLEYYTFIFPYPSIRFCIALCVLWVLMRHALQTDSAKITFSTWHVHCFFGWIIWRWKINSLSHACFWNMAKYSERRWIWDAAVLCFSIFNSSCMITYIIPADLADLFSSLTVLGRLFMISTSAMLNPTSDGCKTHEISSFNNPPCQIDLGMTWKVKVNKCKLSLLSNKSIHTILF